MRFDPRGGNFWESAFWRLGQFLSAYILGSNAYRKRRKVHQDESFVSAFWGLGCLRSGGWAFGRGFIDPFVHSLAGASVEVRMDR